MYHGEPAALKAEENWNATFRDKSGPTDDQIQIILVEGEGDVTLVEALITATVVKSKGEVRRLIESNGIRVNAEPATDPDQTLANHDRIDVGKHRYFRLRLKK